MSEISLDPDLIRGMVRQATCPSPMIEHTVTFRLKHPSGSTDETSFLAAAGELASIAGVRNFRIRRQTSPKNDHTFGISMEFESAATFREYCDHPAHTAFVEERWLVEVEDFRETDFEPIRE